MTLNDPAVVAEEYATEDGLRARQSAYRYSEGADARELALEAVLETSPRRVLEVGCGPGEAASRIAAHGVEVVAIDLSPRMVELTRARDIDARVGDVQELPFPDASFDCALAAWMLYHVPDVGRALDELARVLGPGGRLVAVTNRRGHLRELRELLGTGEAATPFNDGNAPELLAARFSTVDERDASGWITFPDRAAVETYVDASRRLWARELPPEVEGPLRVRREPVVYVAEKA